MTGIEPLCKHEMLRGTSPMDELISLLLIRYHYAKELSQALISYSSPKLTQNGSKTEV